jgi:pimeloyl-ACP methyl ester carboxylesterase
MDVDPAPYTFSLLLRAEDTAPRPTWVADRRCVVLLHGWLQDHSCWLTTAHQLRRRFGHSVLLLDWLHHGRSESPTDPSQLTPLALVKQLRALLERIGWAGAELPQRLTIAGCSLGGAVAMLYTSRFAHEVDRLVLVAPAGFDEPWHRVLMHAGRITAATIIRAMRTAGDAGGSLLGRLLGHAHLIRTTPRYGNDHNWFDTPVARAMPILLICAAFDELHRANNWAGCRKGDPNFRLRLLPVNHAFLCQHLACLGLELDTSAWHGDVLPAQGARSRL